jgi:hypothetical protein
MELKLIVLAGAKQGTEIPLKKDKFIIGRAKECSLRAGSEAISRRHCAIVRSNGAWTVRDLGSRNGTHVNEQKIEQEVPLNAGDELRVGPLKFRVAAISAAPIPALSTPSPGPVKVQDLNRGKQPPVKDVADVAERMIGKAVNEDLAEDDISNWLLGVKDGNSDGKETLTLRLEETKSISRKSVEDGTADEVSETEETKPGDANSEDATEKSGWNWFKRGSKAAVPKKKPGKLPPRPNDGPVKSSGDAAADVLREMTRRR